MEQNGAPGDSFSQPGTDTRHHGDTQQPPLKHEEKDMSSVIEQSPATRVAAVAASQAELNEEVSVEEQQVTDGFHLVIDALKLNGIDTIFGLPGIPITD